jgi:pilus assembly protein CpaC
VRTNTVFTVACFLVSSLGIYAAPFLEGQSSTSATSTVGITGQDAANDISVVVGKSVVVDCARPVQRIAVGLGEFVEADAISPSEIIINGKAPGETTLIIWETDGNRQFFNVTVRPNGFVANDRLQALRRELRLELPGQDIQVSAENDFIFLRGNVKDLNGSDRAVQIASTAGKVVNLLYVKVPDVAPQILLKVRFASVDRSLSKQLGLNLFSTGATNSIGSISTGQFTPPLLSLPNPSSPAEAAISDALNLFIFRPDINLGATIAAMENMGVVQVLAEPNVLAENGKQASFLAGGEYPYPVVQGSTGAGTGAITIEFKEFGVRLNFIPTIMPQGTIRLQVAPEVSSLDFTNAVEISGFQVPAIDIRSVKTEVELSEGQSFAIGGLLDNRVNQTFQKIPFLGDVPILGKFFQSISKTKSNTELIVIVTPEIVPPMPVGTPLPELKYPVKFLPPNSDIPMHTPDGRTPDGKTSGVSPVPVPQTMPVEKLVESMKPERPLAIDGSISPGAYNSTGGGTGSTPQQ